MGKSAKTLILKFILGFEDTRTVFTSIGVLKNNDIAASVSAISTDPGLGSIVGKPSAGRFESILFGVAVGVGVSVATGLLPPLPKTIYKNPKKKIKLKINKLVFLFVLIQLITRVIKSIILFYYYLPLHKKSGLTGIPSMSSSMCTWSVSSVLFPTIVPDGYVAPFVRGME